MVEKCLSCNKKGTARNPIGTVVSPSHGMISGMHQKCGREALIN